MKSIIPVHLAFTGTRNGMTPEQEQSIHDFLVENNQTLKSYCHGGCVGADEDFHNMVLNENSNSIVAVYYVPGPLSFITKDFIESASSNILLREKKGHLSRNREIVDKANYLIGCPPTAFPTRRGGTWYTLRYAKKTNCAGTIFYPHGTIANLQNTDLTPQG